MSYKPSKQNVYEFVILLKMRSQPDEIPPITLFESQLADLDDGT
jgi:hypothetical protein